MILITANSRGQAVTFCWRLTPVVSRALDALTWERLDQVERAGEAWLAWDGRPRFQRIAQILFAAGLVALAVAGVLAWRLSGWASLPSPSSQPMVLGIGMVVLGLCLAFHDAFWGAAVDSWQLAMAPARLAFEPFSPLLWQSQERWMAAIAYRQIDKDTPIGVALSLYPMDLSALEVVVLAALRDPSKLARRAAAGGRRLENQLPAAEAQAGKKNRL